MPKSVYSSITDIITLLLNTPIVPPLPKQTKDVALTELPHSTPRRRAEELELERSRSVGLAAGDISLQRMSGESPRTSTQSRRSSDQSSRDDVPTGMVAPVVHQLSRRSSYIQEELEIDLHLALDAERAMRQAET
ncbi:hypothetical protein DEU56DRAFT_452867 [Suillus clintonianus]|uniref:uncharacterized protein n=1 Tax=Suillus clintonianus TaxID=1904413 RepID=UPI001B85D904|nr:uncharacterized protein DEU56DRAFT_452867 [Suillus clintonianus]KAG2131828.1 hypothetical protein DEU56DRAFT_452867 [Suillus clintonianus]